MEHGNHRLHAGVKNGIDQIIVVVKGLLIDRSARQDKRQDASPWNRETIVLDAHGCQALNVLLVEEVVLIGDVVLGLGAVDQLLQKGRRTTVEGHGAFDLSGATSNTKHKVFGEVIAVGGAEIVLGRQDKLAAWNRSRADSGRIQSGGSLEEIVSITR